jgi:holo-[acyl-carrier-protein] synthase
MITGIGCDIIELSRFENKSKLFINKILTKQEIILYNQRIKKRKIEFIAGHFAAKEAIIKATGIAIPFNELNIFYDKYGKPLCNFNNLNILISISHNNNSAMAMAVVY